jgi:hypothetical protein
MMTEVIELQPNSQQVSSPQNFDLGYCARFTRRRRPKSVHNRRRAQSFNAAIRLTACRFLATCSIFPIETVE